VCSCLASCVEKVPEREGVDWKGLFSGANFITEMTAIQAAKTEWEQNSEPRFVPRRGRKIEWTEEFRQYGLAKAWLEWDDGLGIVQITKIEASSQGHGEGTRLVEFLKVLADKYHITLFGTAVYYDPNSTTPNECPPSPEWVAKQERLVEWYRRCGFQIKESENCPPEVWYPGIPTE